MHGKTWLWDPQIPIEHSSVAAFYSADTCDRIKTIEMEAKNTEMDGTLELPAGNIILRILTGNWEVDMDS